MVYALTGARLPIMSTHTPHSSSTPSSFFSNPIHLRFARTPVKVWAYDFLTNTGFQIQSPDPALPGDRQSFDIELGEGLVLTVQAVCIHCRAASSASASGPRFVIDWEFDGDPALDDLLRVAGDAYGLELTSH